MEIFFREIMQKRRRHIAILTMLAAVLATGCTDKEAVVVPSFVSVDAIKLVMPTEDALSTDSGFYVSDIVAARLVAHYPGRTTLDTIGLFELPLTAPVLYDGTVDYIEIFPTVEQSGSSKALIPYTFYKSIRIDGAELHREDTLTLGTLTTTFDPVVEALMFEPFEPTEGSLLFDSVMTWEPHAAGDACTGEGYGRIHVTSDQSSRNCAIKRDFTVADKTKALYLELDTRSDMSFEVYMHSRYTGGGAIDRQPVMVVRASEQWEHLYINLGRTWYYFNYYPDFTLSISALNVDGKEGDLRLDNVKLITRP